MKQKEFGTAAAAAAAAAATVFLFRTPHCSPLNQLWFPSAHSPRKYHLLSPTYPMAIMPACFFIFLAFFNDVIYLQLSDIVYLTCVALSYVKVRQCRH